MKIIKSATLDSIEATIIDVEATFTKGMPSFTIVGMVSASINESKDRIKSSLLLNNFKFPPLKITINLSPSELNKKGSHFDLPIALQVALFDENKIEFDDFFFFGELALDGTIKDTSHIFAIVLSLAKKGELKRVVSSLESAKKLGNIPNIDIYVVNTLNSAIEFVKSKDKDNYLYKKEEIKYHVLTIKDEQYFYNKKYDEDFKDVIGQDMAKYAALICAAGNHNFLMEGSPGCGKSMIAKRLQYILAPMNLEEILEKAKLQALDLKDVDFSPIRAFRNPLEDNKILISRVNSKILYETKFIFVSAMNPCPCGNKLSSVKECRCSDFEVQRYKNRLSEPFLDRIDLYVVMNDSFSDNKNIVSSKELHESVIKAFIRQKNRGQKELNGKLNDKDIKKYCVLDSETSDILEKARVNYSLSFRSINKILKVARTIADINENEFITKGDLLKSLNFRKR